MCMKQDTIEQKIASDTVVSNAICERRNLPSPQSRPPRQIQIIRVSRLGAEVGCCVRAITEYNGDFSKWKSSINLNHVCGELPSLNADMDVLNEDVKCVLALISAEEAPSALASQQTAKTY